MNNKKEIKFSIPYNGDLDLIKWALDSGQVYEVYFAGSRDDDFSSPYVNFNTYSFKEICLLLNLCNKNNIKLNLLLNKYTLFFEDFKKIIKYIKRLQKIGKGINSVTISDKYAVSYLKNKFPDIRLQSSIFMGIDNFLKARSAVLSGIDELCLDPSLNRNFSELSKIMKLKKNYPHLSVKLLGIHGCYADCQYSWQHPTLPVFYKILKISSLKNNNNIFGKLINFDKCLYKIQDISDEIKRPFIRPEDIAYYEENMLADYIKIAYRDDSSLLLKEKLDAYFKRNYNGNLFHILYSNNHNKIYCDNKKIPFDFIKKVMSCDKDCDHCYYCKRLAKKCLIYT